MYINEPGGNELNSNELCEVRPGAVGTTVEAAEMRRNPRIFIAVIKV